MASSAIGMAAIPLGKGESAISIAMAASGLRVGLSPDIRFVCAFQVVRSGCFGSLKRVSVEESGKKWTKVEEGC
jgi:hypothetical protein